MTVEQKCAGVSKFSPKLTEDGKDLGLGLWAGGLDVLLILASSELGDGTFKLLFLDLRTVY